MISSLTIHTVSSRLFSIGSLAGSAFVPVPVSVPVVLALALWSINFAAESQDFGLKLGIDSGFGWVDKGESNGEDSRSDDDDGMGEGVESQSQFQGGGDGDVFGRLRLGVSSGDSSGVIWRFEVLSQGTSQLGGLSMSMVRS